ncbi:D-alanyl-D-alanine carboxypeptidase family protein [Kocuria sp. M1R5S2]|uniref:M15 family metallopeptidase n=1 Tax=Kocuria rhizosphaerae TaxID=3376285 RepID=UPI0037890599
MGWSRAAAALLLAVLAAGCAPETPPPSAPATSVPATSSPAVAHPTVASPAAASASPTPPGDPAHPGPEVPDPRPAPGPRPDLDDPASTAVVVNKRRPLVPADWAPPALQDVEGHRMRPEVAAALRGLLAEARAAGVPIRIVSGYRSYDVQAETYAGWVAQLGQAEADAVSARPGHSEHQTGLAVDVGDGGPCDLRECFAGTAAGTWVAEHGPRHGFVIRYPQGARATTGYAYEPWHLRYLGPERAGALVRSGAGTLEEFSGLPPAPDYPAEPPRDD